MRTTLNLGRYGVIEGQVSIEQGKLIIEGDTNIGEDEKITIGDIIEFETDRFDGDGEILVEDLKDPSSILLDEDHPYIDKYCLEPQTHIDVFTVFLKNGRKITVTVEDDDSLTIKFTEKDGKFIEKKSVPFPESEAST